MLGSKYPDGTDAFSVATGEKFLASEIFNQISEIVENTQRALGQGLADFSAIGTNSDRPNEDTFAEAWLRIFRIDYGRTSILSGTSITTSNQGTFEHTITFNTYGGSSVFSDASKIRVFVMEEGGNTNSKTLGHTGLKDCGNVVDGSITTAQFKYRHNNPASTIGHVQWIAVQWEG
jgi:hypothetical protein|tara:strand:- start:205 stop:732 length:528 start_codon:yes stop_codon:yes gene_type:complete